MENRKTVRWRKFSHASYAVFCSLHKEVSIGVLSVAILINADAKAAVSHDTTSVHRTSEEEIQETQLESIEITASRVPLTSEEAARMVTVMRRTDIEAASVHSINDLLEYAIGVDVRQRGEMGIQTDISIRGGTFDQITLLLNGVNISSPHTGHLSADFPVPMQDIERIEILEGPAARLFGTSAFTGAINIVTKKPSETGGEAHLFGGQYGLGGGEASLYLATGKVSQTISGSLNRCDGATENSDFKQIKGFYQGSFENKEIAIDWQGGYSQQAFGANTFYSAAYPNQWEGTKRIITSIHAETKGKVHIAPTISWTRSYDHFQLIRDTHTGENFHRTDVYGINLNFWTQWFLGKTSFGTEIRNEGIISSSLGKKMIDDSIKIHGEDNSFYKYKDNRTNISYYLEHDFLLRRWTFSLGILANMNSVLTNELNFYPGIDISYRPNHKWKIFASWNKALRMPTFTDLYYKSPTNEGNIGLKPEETSAFNLGTKFRDRGYRAEGSLFYHQGKNMIDWIMYTSDDIYHSGNFELVNIGGELVSEILFREFWGTDFPLNRVHFSYAYIYQEREDEIPIYKSNYALEYLKHKIVIKIDSKIFLKLNGSLSYRWQDRMGSYILYDDETHKNTGKLIEYSPYGVVDLKVSWDDSNYSIYAEANNLFNTTYYDLGNIPQPGIWIKTGVKVRFH